MKRYIELLPPEDAAAAMVATVEQLPVVTVDVPVDAAHDEALSGVLEAAFEARPWTEALAVAGRDGTVAAIARQRWRLPDASERPSSRLQEFLAQVESPTPIVLRDAYDVRELTWMCDRLRTSERFGADNHLYLRYSSRERLECAMREEDWSGVTDAGKAVFLFDGDEQPSTGRRQREPQPLSIEEIVEIVDCIPCGFSGSDFFYMILDSHPNLLTIGWHGLATFPELYRCSAKARRQTKLWNI